MSHNLRRRVLAGSVVFGLVAAWAPTSVFAHVEFEDPPATIAPNTDVPLTLHVPNEREASNFNVAVAVQLPEGWSGVSCETKPTWTCEITTDSDPVEVHFDKDDGAAAAEDEVFEFTLHSSATLGTATFKTIQTYDTGEEVAWIGEPGSDEPAPTLEVADAASPTVPTTDGATTTAAAVTTQPATTLAPSEPTSPDAATTVEPATTAATAETTGDTVTILETTVTSTPDSDDDNGNTGAIIAVALLAAVAVVAGTIIYLRRRNPPVPPVPPTAGGGPNVGV